MPSATKELIKQFNAEAKQTAWTVNGKHSEGKKMVGQIARLLMEAFNGECDEIVRKVTYSNVNKSLERIDKIAENVKIVKSSVYLFLLDISH